MSDTDQRPSLETRAHEALVELSALTGSVLHDPEAVLRELVTEAENLAYRLSTATVASDFNILRDQAIKLSALLHSAFARRDAPEAPQADLADAAHA